MIRRNSLPCNHNDETQFELGIHDLENSLTEIVFPPNQGKNRERYWMGNGFVVTSADEAADRFLQREFNAIANCRKTPHPPVFVPDIFISKLKSKVKIQVT